MSASQDINARQHLLNAWQEVFGGEPSHTVQQITQAVAFLESGGMYGTAKYKNRVTGEVTANTNNIGSVQCKGKAPCGEGCFEATDTDANGKPYQGCFHRFDTPEEGWAFFLRVLYVNRGRDKTVLPAAETGSAKAMAEAMRASGYFELSAKRYADGLAKDATAIAASLKEPLLVTMNGTAPTPEESRSKGGFIAIAIGALALLLSRLVRK